MLETTGFFFFRTTNIFLLAPSLSFWIHSCLTVKHNSERWWWRLCSLSYVFIHRFGGFGWWRGAVFLDFHMITSNQLGGHWGHRAAAHSSDCCVKSLIHSIASGIKPIICVPDLEPGESFSTRLPSFLDADAGISERGTLLKQPWALFCTECSQHTDYTFII